VLFIAVEQMNEPIATGRSQQVRGRGVGLAGLRVS